MKNLIEDLSYINSQIEQKQQSQKQQENPYVKPERCAFYNLPECVIPNPRSKTYLRKNLAKTLAIMDMLKHVRYSEGCTVLVLPTTSRKLKSICGSQQGVSDMIRFMKQIGLISTENDDYQFNAYYDNDNRCKTYRYYVENEKKIREYCIANKINTFIVQNNQAIKPYRKADELDAFPKSSVIFSSHLHLLKPENWSKKQFEDYLLEVLYENYPSLSYFQGMADDLNETYYKDYPEFQISYTPTFTWNKGKKRGGTAVTKIGIRATNALCSASTKSKEEAKENFCGQFKEDILEKYGFNLQKDVKSSVPRLTLSINSNGWVSEDIDIYEMIYKELVKTVDGGGYPFSKIREVIKALHMRAYFDSPGKLGVHTRRAMKNKMDISDVSNVMRIFQDAVLTVEGNIPYDNEIFFHESNIYLAVTAYLLDDGFFVWEVYDSWYAKMDGVSQSDFEEYVTEVVAGIANQYIDNYYHGYEY